MYRNSLLEKLKSIFSERNKVSDDAAENLIEAYKKLYESSGRYYECEKFNLSRCSVNDVLLSVTDQMKELAVVFNNMRLEKEKFERKLERINKEQPSESKAEKAESYTENQYEQVKNELEKHKELLENEKKDNIKDFVEAMRSFISFRDSMFLMKETADDQGDENVIHIMSGLLKTSKKAFENCGIKILDEDGGTFNPDCQQIVGKVPTENIDMNDKVAETFRCGYQFNNSLIRLQEVKIFEYDPMI